MVPSELLLKLSQDPDGTSFSGLRVAWTRETMMQLIILFSHYETVWPAWAGGGQAEPAWPVCVDACRLARLCCGEHMSSNMMTEQNIVALSWVPGRWRWWWKWCRRPRWRWDHRWSLQIWDSNWHEMFHLTQAFKNLTKYDRNKLVAWLTRFCWCIICICCAVACKPWCEFSYMQAKNVIKMPGLSRHHHHHCCLPSDCSALFPLLMKLDHEAANIRSMWKCDMQMPASS